MNQNYNYEAIIEYDGSKFYGWSRQKNNKPTIQQFIENQFSQFFSLKVNIYSCSRTDKGVHANNQHIMFSIPKQINIVKINFIKLINKHLFPWVKIKKITRRLDDFNVRFDSVSKTYLYKIKKGEYNVFQSNYYWNISITSFNSILNNTKLSIWKNLILGTHNFSNYIYKSSHLPLSSCNKTINSVDIKTNQTSIYIYINGNSFGWNMVRYLVGSLYQLCNNEISIKEFKNSFNDNTNIKLIKAPPNGLYLHKIYYK